MSDIERSGDLSPQGIEGNLVPADTFVADPAYDLFISYKRSDAASHAAALRKWLKRYRLPRSLQTEERKRNLEVYLDEINVRAKSDFLQEIVPALGQSRFFLVVNSKDAAKAAQDGTPNWVVRELLVFRNDGNPRRDQIVAATLDANFGAPLPGGLDKELPRIERIDIQELTSWWRWWPPKRLRIESELLPLIATLRDIEPDEMATLRREAQRTAMNRLVALSASAIVATFILFFAMIWKVEATRSSFEAIFAQAEASLSGSEAHTITAANAARDGDYLGSIRLLAEAQKLAWTTRAQAAALSLEEPLAVFDHTVEFQAWRTAFSSEGKLALGGFDGEVVLYDPVQMTQVTVRQSDGIPVVDLAFEPSGDLLVVLRKPANAAWNRSGHSEIASRLERISPSGDTVDLGSPPSGAAWLSVARSQNSAVLLAGADDGVWLLDHEAQAWLKLDNGDSRGGPHGPVSLAASSMGDFVAASTIQGAITVWRVADRQLIDRWLVPRPEGTFPYNPFDLVFLESGPDLVFGSFDGSVHRWDFTSGADPMVLAMPHEQAVTSVALTPDGRRLATGGWDAVATVMGVGSTQTAQELSVGHEGLRAGVMDISLSRDGVWLATSEAVPLNRGGVDDPGAWLFGTVRVWRLRAPEEPDPTWQRPWWTVGFDSSGAILSARVENPVRFVKEGQSPISIPAAVNVWDAVAESQREGDSIRALRVDDSFGREGDYVSVQFDHRPGSTLVGSVSLSPSGQRAAFLSAKVNMDGASLVNPEVVLVDLTTGEVVQRRELSLAPIRAFGPLEFFDDETVIASLIATVGAPEEQRGSHVWCWNVSSNSLELIVSIEEQLIFDMAVSSPNGMIAISDDFRTILVLDLDGQEIWRADADRRYANAPAQLSFSPDGRTLFAASTSQLHRWEIRDGWKEVQGSVDTEFKPQDIAVDPSGRLLVIADWNGSLRYVDISSFEQLLVKEMGIGPLLELSISPDGRRIAAIGVSGQRILGGILPSSVEEAERMSRLTIIGGSLARLSSEEESRLVVQFTEPNLGSLANAEDAEFYKILRSSGIALRNPEMWLEWLIATEPLKISEDMEIWLSKHRDHPFASNLVHWIIPQQRQN
ncbi:hypothetical protein [Microbulbifer sp. S227A]|uniref:hypothetical protein n=1 Tax=Microbulbifer sp. S227A TaxID=3415131 RepID=UPI003C79C1CF